MITQIEIDGFKTFKDFKVELAPFQVIVGPNGSGKSNLFDALRLISFLAELNLQAAFQEIRGEAVELFTTLPYGQRTNRMRLAIEMLVNREVQGGGEAAQVEEIEAAKQDKPTVIMLQYTRLRYELQITLGTDTYGLERLYLSGETLKSIPPEKDHWSQKYGLSSQNNWLPESTESTSIPKIFIDTRMAPVGIGETTTGQSAVVEQPMIFLYPDSDRQERTRRFYANEIEQTVMSRVADREHPHILAVQDELRLLRFLHLNPEALRQSSSTIGPRFLSSNGEGLPRMLARMQAEDKFALADVSIYIANLVPGILKIEVKKDLASNEYDIWAETSDRRTFSAKVLSDGTLRLLALAAIRNDTQFHGTVCLEEPENGVEPLHLKIMARVLCEMATDFTDPEQRSEPLRQVLITTHSPAFISLPEIIDSLLFAQMVTIGGSDINSPLRITRMEPVVTARKRPKKEGYPEKDRATEVYTIDSVRQYLARSNFNKADNKLKKARMLSIEQ